jgi:type I restriction enzyme M protein
MDLDSRMITLATLNMLLNGDGEARLFHQPGTGSIDWKIAAVAPSKPVPGPVPVKLDPKQHSGGRWDQWLDGTQLEKFDVVLTNPPFGEDRAFRPRTEEELALVKLYETWGMPGASEGLDLGILFLENAVRVLADNGRLGIVLSNSIASIKKWELVRRWFAQQLRIVAIFDLPPNVFAETGVNTSILVAYKPKKNELDKLNSDGYSVFSRDIKRVGYEKRTRARNVYFNDILKLDEITFETAIDDDGNYVLDEEFSEIVREFRAWVLGQEETLRKLFVD